MASSIRFLALGDSYTVGESVPAEASWPHLLVDRLQALGRPTRVEVVAMTGWTAGELLEAIESEPPRPPFDLVSLLVGVNDQYRGLSIEQYEAALDALLSLAARLVLPGTHGRLAVSIPDWGVTPFAADRARNRIGREIDRFNASFRSKAEAAGVPFVDVTSVSREYADLVAEDGLHPDGRQYERWVEAILPVAVGVLDARL